jgi:hypothetical protein
MPRPGRCKGQQLRRQHAELADACIPNKHQMLQASSRNALSSSTSELGQHKPRTLLLDTTLKSPNAWLFQPSSCWLCKPAAGIVGQNHLLSSQAMNKHAHSVLRGDSECVTHTVQPNRRRGFALQAGLDPTIAWPASAFSGVRFENSARLLPSAT